MSLTSSDVGASLANATETLGAGGCPTIHSYDPTPCSTCVANNGQSSSLCVWCPSSRTCDSIGVGSLVNPPCGDNATGMAIAPSDCQDCKAETCSECTRFGNVGCVWIKEGARDFEVSVLGVKTPSFSWDISNTCVPGSPLGPRVQSWGFQYSGTGLTATPHVDQWCWANCAIPSYGMIALLTTVPLALIAGCIIKRRRMRAHAVAAQGQAAQTLHYHALAPAPGVPVQQLPVGYSYTPPQPQQYGAPPQPQQYGAPPQQQQYPVGYSYSYE